MNKLIKVENKSKEEIAEIGRKIGEAFVAEKAGIVTMLTKEQAVRAFEIMTECYYRAGVLYQPFSEAASKGIPCVLDTDTSLKVKKYIRCGMELCGEKKLKHGISLYTMAYNRTAESKVMRRKRHEAGIL